MRAAQNGCDTGCAVICFPNAGKMLILSPVHDFVSKYGGWCAWPDNVEEIRQVEMNVFDLHRQSWF